MTYLGKEWKIIVGSQPGQPTVSPDITQALTHMGIEGATVSYASGLYKGKVEQSIVVLLSGFPESHIFLVAERLRDQFNQETVYVSDGRDAYLI